MKKKIILLLIFGFCLFTCCSCGNKSDSQSTKKNLKSISYDYQFIGFSSTFKYSSDDKFENFEVKTDDNATYLYFENSALKTKYRLEARLVIDSFVKRVDKERKKYKKYKEIKIKDYDGYIYSGDNDLNYASIFLKLKKEDSYYYIINIDINALDEVASSEEDYVYDTLIKDEKIIDFLDSIEFKTNIKVFLDYVDSEAKKNDG